MATASVAGRYCMTHAVPDAPPTSLSAARVRNAFMAAAPAADQ